MRRLVRSGWRLWVARWPGGAAAGSGGSQRVHGRVWLPVAVSTLVGREQERGEVAERVAQTRLVTLTGSGGCGKTRLALEVAHEVATGFDHGVWWVELSGVGHPASGSARRSPMQSGSVRSRGGRWSTRWSSGCTIGAAS
jgi:hypothetical protein